MTFAVVLVGGAMPDRRLLKGAENAKIVVAADSGVRIARNHGLAIDVVVGDLDSASGGDIAWARAEGATIVEHDTDKDETDLELALDTAEAAGADRIIAIGVDGGRLDHDLGNWNALCGERAARVEVHTGTGRAMVLHGGRHGEVTLSGSVGDVVSLIPRFGAAHGVTTSGLKWPLDDATLRASSTRGVSNQFASTEATVSLASGTLLVVRPTVGPLD